MPVVGFLHPGSPEPFSFLVVAFQKGLKEAGYVESQNVTIEYLWAKGHYEQLPTLAADFVQRQVAVIAATGGSISAHAAKAATPSILLFLTSAMILSGQVLSRASTDRAVILRAYIRYLLSWSRSVWACYANWFPKLPLLAFF
jgi:hypothetical protein